MSRPLICLMLIASLLVTGARPCCLLMAVASEAETEQGCHSESAQSPADVSIGDQSVPANDGSNACQQCAQCLQPAASVLDVMAMPSAAPQPDRPWPQRTGSPESRFTPLLRPPIRPAATA